MNNSLGLTCASAEAASALAMTRAKQETAVRCNVVGNGRLRRAAEQRQELAQGEGDRVERAERAKIIESQVAELPLEQRELIALQFYVGLSQREMAAVLDLPRSTVQSRVRCALESLRDKLRGSGHAALIPALEPVLTQTPALPVPEALSMTLDSLASSASTTAVATTTGATLSSGTVGGIIVNQTLTIAITSGLLIGGLSFFAGRVSGPSKAADSLSRTSKARTGYREIEVDKLEQLESELESLKVRKQAFASENQSLKRTIEQLESQLATNAVPNPDSAAARSTDSTAPNDFDTCGQLLGENLELVARIALDNDRTLLATERAKVMKIQSELVQLIGEVSEITTQPLYDGEFGPKIFDMFYGAGLQLSEGDRARVREISDRVRQAHLDEIDLDQAAAIERYANRTSMLDEISAELRQIMPEDSRAAFERMDGVARELTAGGRAEIQIGVDTKDFDQEFESRVLESWRDIYAYDADREGEVAEISKRLSREYRRYYQERLAENSEFDPNSFEARMEFMAIQTQAERQVLELLSLEQREQSTQRLPAFFSVTSGSNVRIDRTAGGHF